MDVSKILRQKRIDDGALMLASSEVHFTKDANYQPIDIGILTC